MYAPGAAGNQATTYPCRLSGSDRFRKGTFLARMGFEQIRIDFALHHRSQAGNQKRLWSFCFRVQVDSFGF